MSIFIHFFKLITIYKKYTINAQGHNNNMCYKQLIYEKYSEKKPSSDRTSFLLNIYFYLFCCYHWLLLIIFNHLRRSLHQFLFRRRGGFP